jgi:hypothetical protein
MFFNTGGLQRYSNIIFWSSSSNMFRPTFASVSKDCKKLRTTEKILYFLHHSRNSASSITAVPSNVLDFFRPVQLPLNESALGMILLKITRILYDTTYHPFTQYNVTYKDKACTTSIKYFSFSIKYFSFSLTVRRETQEIFLHPL